MSMYPLSALAVIEFEPESPLGFVLLMLVYVATSSSVILVFRVLISFIKDFF